MTPAEQLEFLQTGIRYNLFTKVEARYLLDNSGRWNQFSIKENLNEFVTNVRKILDERNFLNTLSKETVDNELPKS